MKTKDKNLRLLRQQLDQRFSQIPKNLLQRPEAGWIRTLRKSLGISGAALARRLGINTPSMAELEASEVRSTITLSSLNKIAEALDCRAYVTLIPNQPLEKILHDRARKTAERLVLRNSRNMDLEAQGLSQKFQDQQISELTEELLRNSDKRIWDDL